MSEMHVKVFCDSNIFLYSIDELANPSKRTTAAHWLGKLAYFRLAVCNLQVVNEVTNVLLKKRRMIPPDQIFDYADTVAILGNLPLNSETVVSAKILHLQLRYSWWDCLLLASALELGCSHFLSEDLQDGQQIGDMTIINPFLHAPEEIFRPD